MMTYTAGAVKNCQLGFVIGVTVWITELDDLYSEYTVTVLIMGPPGALIWHAVCDKTHSARLVLALENSL